MLCFLRWKRTEGAEPGREKLHPPQCLRSPTYIVFSRGYDILHYVRAKRRQVFFLQTH
jgi:hypothetical protein